MKKKFIFLLTLLFLGKNEIKAVPTDFPTLGDDKKVNTFASGTFVLEEGDTVGTTNRGFCYFTRENGLQIGKTAASGHVEFKTPLPIEWKISLHEEVYLRLAGDMFTSGEVAIASSGYIQGGSNRICLLGPLDLQSYWISAIGNYSIRFSGNGNTIFFNEGGSIRQPSSSYDLEFRSTILNGVSQDSLQVDGNLILYDSTIRLISDYCFNSSGILKIYDDVLITGTNTFCLDAPCEIYDNARLMFDIGTTFSMGTHGSITIADNHTGMIHFNGSSVLIGATDFNVDYGRIIFENEVTIDDDGNYGEFIINTNSRADILGCARVVLENTSTFSLL